jgi:hypothetical protein
MTLKTELAIQESARRYQTAAIQSAESYRAGRIAQEAAATAAAEAHAAAARAASLPVIVDLPVASPAPATVTHVSVDRRIGPAPDTGGNYLPPEKRTGLDVTPLSQANVDAWVADEGRFDPEGVRQLQAEWGNDMASNLGYVRQWLHSTLSAEQRERAMDANILSVDVVRFLASIAREASHSPTASSTTTKGPQTMAETLSRSNAEKKFRALTSELHAARARGEHIRARELADERDLLAAALFPGDNRPAEGERKVI